MPIMNTKTKKAYAITFISGLCVKISLTPADLVEVIRRYKVRGYKVVVPDEEQ